MFNELVMVRIPNPALLFVLMRMNSRARKTLDICERGGR